MSINRSISIDYSSDELTQGKSITVVDVGETSESLKTCYITPIWSHDQRFHKIHQGYKRLFVISDSRVTMRLLNSIPSVSRAGQVKLNLPGFVEVKSPKYGYKPKYLKTEYEEVVETLRFENSEEQRPRYQPHGSPKIIAKTGLDGSLSFNAESGAFVTDIPTTGALTIKYQVKGQIWLVPYDFSDIKQEVPIDRGWGYIRYDENESALGGSGSSSATSRTVRNVVIISNDTDSVAHEISESVLFWSRPTGGAVGALDFNNAIINFLNEQIFTLQDQTGETGGETYTATFETTSGAALSLAFKKQKVMTEVAREATEVDIPDASGQPSGIRVERIDNITFESDEGEQLRLVFKHGA